MITMLPTRSKLFALGLVALTGCVTSPGPSAAATPAACITPAVGEIAALSERWAQALAGGRVEEVAGLYAEDAVLLAEGHAEPIRGRSAIRTYLDALARRHPEARIAMREIMTRCGLASEMSETRFQVTGRRKGTRMFIGGRINTLYAQDGASWRIVQQSLPTMTQPNRAK